jgi:hypothetical protein
MQRAGPGRRVSGTGGAGSGVVELLVDVDEDRVALDLASRPGKSRVSG